MSDGFFNSENLVDQAKSVILQNVSHEQFGVVDLTEAMNSSRPNLLRKIKQ